MQATSIDEVIQFLDQIIETSIREKSRDGYFAALYKKVTEDVKLKIHEGYFENGPRMERLDVVFANRYLAAYTAYRANNTTTQSWKLAFDQDENNKLIVLQHLFLGMNAHINLDLGIAAAEVCPGEEIFGLEEDFMKINEVLSSLVNGVVNDLTQIWPFMRIINALAGKLDDRLADFSMEIARDGAWETALKAAPLHTKVELENFIHYKDGKVYNFGYHLAHPGKIISFVVWLIRIGERGSIPDKIKILED